MSTYDDYKKRVTEMSNKLKPVKEVDQTVLWLKAAATKRIELDVDKYDLDGELFVGKGGQDSFGFKEKTVNLLLQYAFEAGLKRNADVFKRNTEDLQKALKDITEIVDDAGFIDWPDC